MMDPIKTKNNAILSPKNEIDLENKYDISLKINSPANAELFKL